jgi:hypothetical protein
MAGCVELTRNMLRSPVDLTVEEADLDFLRAKEIADDRVRRDWEDPMLLAWFDGKSGAFSPRVECCNETRPAWLVYAESRGGDVVIDINREEYVFIYRSEWF